MAERAWEEGGGEDGDNGSGDGLGTWLFNTPHPTCAPYRPHTIVYSIFFDNGDSKSNCIQSYLRMACTDCPLYPIYFI